MDNRKVFCPGNGRVKNIVQKDCASYFGIVEVDSGARTIGFQGKPEEVATTIPGSAEHCCASMGIYLFNASDIIHELKGDAGTSPAHDFGSNILPGIMKSGRISPHEFIDTKKEEAKCRRGVGDNNVYIPAGTAIGYNPGEDMGRLHVSRGGVMVIPKGAEVR